MALPPASQAAQMDIKSILGVPPRQKLSRVDASSSAFFDAAKDLNENGNPDSRPRTNARKVLFLTEEEKRFKTANSNKQTLLIKAPPQEISGCAKILGVISAVALIAGAVFLALSLILSWGVPLIAMSAALLVIGAASGGVTAYNILSSK